MRRIRSLSTFFILAAFILGVTAMNGRAEHGAPLVFLHYWTGALSGGIDAMMKAYNENTPGNPVKATGFEHESFKVGIPAILDSDTPPDMVSYWAGARVQSLVDRKLLAPIDEAWERARLDKVFPATVSKACTYNGKKYALPVTQHYVAVFYNVAIFNQLGLTPPKTWEAFIATCEALRQAGVTPIALGSMERWPAQFWFDYLLLRSAGPRYRDRLMRGEASYEDPQVVKAMTLWQSLFNAEYFNANANQLNWSDAAKLVYSGSAAMTLMGTWAIGLFEGQLEWKQHDDFDYFPFPVLSKKVPDTALGPIDVIVAARKGHPAMVNDAIAYFSEPGPQMNMSQGSGALAPTLAIPRSFYTPMQGRILKTVRTADSWAFNYDLATAPEVAEMGLDAFRQFVADPNLKDVILHELSKKVRRHYEREE